MPDIIEGPPEAGGYRYVLVRFDRPPTQTYLVANYGETKRTRVVDWPKEWQAPPYRGNPNHPSQRGGKVVMAFVQDRHLRDRCERMGWIDITERWFERLAHPDAGPTPPVSVDASPTAGGARVIPIQGGPKKAAPAPAPSRAAAKAKTTAKK